MAVKNKPEISLRYAQGEVFNCDKRFRVLVAGRRFGKSYLSCIELLRGAINRPGEVYFYCAPTYRMAKDIAWKELKRLVPKVWVQSKNETDLRLELINGSTIVENRSGMIDKDGVLLRLKGEMLHQKKLKLLESS